MGKLRDSYRSMRQGDEEARCRISHLRRIGCTLCFSDFPQFDNVGHKADVEKIIEAFEKHCIGEANVTYERYVFHQRIQQSGECFEDFLGDLRMMARTCQFEQLEDTESSLE